MPGSVRKTPAMTQAATAPLVTADQKKRLCGGDAGDSAAASSARAEAMRDSSAGFRGRGRIPARRDSRLSKDSVTGASWGDVLRHPMHDVIFTGGGSIHDRPAPFRDVGWRNDIARQRCWG